MSAPTRVAEPVLALIIVGAGVLLGYGAWMATQSESESAIPDKGDVMVASKGEAFDSKAFLVPGKYTIFDFYADWCAPCRMLDPKLRKLAAERDDVALRKVDIIDWSSAVVKQYGVTDLPHLRIYDPNGILVAQGDDAFPAVEKIFGVEIF